MKQQQKKNMRNAKMSKIDKINALVEAHSKVFAWNWRFRRKLIDLQCAFYEVARAQNL